MVFRLRPFAKSAIVQVAGETILSYQALRGERFTLQWGLDTVSNQSGKKYYWVEIARIWYINNCMHINEWANYKMKREHFNHDKLKHVFVISNQSWESWSQSHTFQGRSHQLMIHLNHPFGKFLTSHPNHFTLLTSKPIKQTDIPFVWVYEYWPGWEPL